MLPPEGEVNGRHAGALARADFAQHVPLGRLDLDDVRPQVAQNPGGIGTEDDRREVDDSVSGEWSVHVARLLPRSRLVGARGECKPPEAREGRDPLLPDADM